MSKTPHVTVGSNVNVAMTHDSARGAKVTSIGSGGQINTEMLDATKPDEPITYAGNVPHVSEGKYPCWYQNSPRESLEDALGPVGSRTAAKSGKPVPVLSKPFKLAPNRTPSQPPTPKPSQPFSPRGVPPKR